ncbi:uncharacterized protein LOC125559095 [Nematostella vectensis]|uniref:uncharacterized protein LOC125559095 n=1 Tax=Nematostella vectensis TaxID=45351 RepID=UPI002076E059|nr:uncharacterized protein LOC125559095 [Nematostella vectensis]
MGLSSVKLSLQYLRRHGRSSIRPHPPTYAQSNGKAENAVETVKRLFKKCKASGVSEFQAFLDWRNTPTAGIGTSPAQRLMGRRCKTLLPVAGSLLQPRHSTEEETRRLIGAKERQRHYYDQHARPLPPIGVGESVSKRLPGEKTWSAGTCVGQAGPGSYEVKVGDGTYRRNRRQVIGTGTTEAPTMETIPDQAPVADDEEEDPIATQPNSLAPAPNEPRRSQRAVTPGLATGLYTGSIFTLTGLSYISIKEKERCNNIAVFS